MADVALVRNMPRSISEQIHVISQAIAMMMQNNPQGGTYRWVMVVEPINSEGASMSTGIATPITDNGKVAELLMMGYERLCQNGGVLSS